MNRQLFFISVLLLGSISKAICCLAATQERIFPVGTNEGCMVGIELISNRYGGDDFQELWDFEISLKGYNEDYSDYVIVKFDAVKGLANEEVTDMIKQYMSQAIDYSQSLDNFDAFHPVTISFCDFQKECSSSSLTQIDDRLRLNYGGTSHPIYFLDSTYKGEMAKPYLDYFEFYFDQASSVIGEDLKISSVRRLQNTTQSIVLFHLGTGQEFKEPNTDKYPIKKEYEFENTLKTLEDAVYLEPILHHGKGFDYFVLSDI